MSKTYDRPIRIQIRDEATEDWVDLFDRPIHAKVNKSSKDSRYLNAGSIQDQRALTFEVRYFSDLEPITYEPQLYRILFEERPFTIKDTDDYQLQHKTITFLGVSY